MHYLVYICIPLLLLACASTSTIHTQPLGAEVHINGQRCGVSPCIHHERHGFPDRMRVQIRSPGYKSAEFFVDTEPPVASFLLYGFGSYFLHAFAKEYRFELEALDATTIAQHRTGKTILFDDTELSNILEQCLYWSEQNIEDASTQKFVASAAALDCKLAESAINTPRVQSDDPGPALARNLIRYIELRRSLNLTPVNLPWSTQVLCNSAKVEYARRIGFSEVPQNLPGFDQLCPEAARQLRNK